MTTKYLDSTGLTYLWGKLKAYFQPKLVSGTNIKTINNQSLLGSGNISISGGGGAETDPVFLASPAGGISAEDVVNWDAKSDFSGDYNDLTNKPTIPSISNLIIVDTYSSSGYDFSSSQSRSLTRSLTTHSGYTPYVLKCVCTNKVSLIVYNHYISSGTLTYEVVNRTSSSVSGASFSIAVMWIKNGILG